MQIYYQGQVNKKEYTKAILLHSGRQSRWMRWVSGIGITLLVISFIAVTIQRPASRDLLPGFLFMLVIMSAPWWTPYLQASSYNQTGNIYRAPIKGVIDDTGVTINGAETKANTLWKGYTHFIHSDDMVLLYQGKNRFNIFTKAMFSNEVDWKLFLDALNSKFSQTRSKT